MSFSVLHVFLKESCNVMHSTDTKRVAHCKGTHKIVSAKGVTPHNGRKSLILAPQEIPDISGYQWGFGCQFVKAYITENPVTNQKIL